MHAEKILRAAHAVVVVQGQRREACTGFLEILRPAPFAASDLTAPGKCLRPVDGGFRPDAMHPALHLIGTAMMQLAAGRGVIPLLGKRAGKREGPGRNVLAEPFAADVQRVFPRGQTLPGRHANRRGRAGRVVNHRAFGQTVEVGRSRHGIAHESRRVIAELVGHEEEDVHADFSG